MFISLFQSHGDMVIWPFFCMYPLLWFDCVCLVPTLWTCYVQVKLFCSGLCSNYEMHSLLLIHKSELINIVFLFNPQDHPEDRGGEFLRPWRAGTRWRWSWHALKATEQTCQWCGARSWWGGSGRKWRRTQWRIVYLLRKGGVVRHIKVTLSLHWWPTQTGWCSSMWNGLARSLCRSRNVTRHSDSASSFNLPSEPLRAMQPTRSAMTFWRVLRTSRSTAFLLRWSNGTCRPGLKFCKLAWTWVPTASCVAHATRSTASLCLRKRMPFDLTWLFRSC